MERPPNFDGRRFQWPIVMPQEADTPDQPARLEFDSGPLGDAVVLPLPTHSLDEGSGLFAVQRSHELPVLRLRIDLSQGIDIGIDPLPE